MKYWHCSHSGVRRFFSAISLKSSKLLKNNSQEHKEENQQQEDKRRDKADKEILILYFWRLLCCMSFLGYWVKIVVYFYLDGRDLGETVFVWSEARCNFTLGISTDVNLLHLLLAFSVQRVSCQECATERGIFHVFSGCFVEQLCTYNFLQVLVRLWVCFLACRVIPQ